MKDDQPIDIFIGNIFMKYFVWFDGQYPKSGFFFIDHSAIINQNPIIMSFISYSFGNVHWNDQNF